MVATKQEEKTVVEFKNITFGYNKDVITLDDVSFSINENEYICIIGHNGSGKSTLSKILTGILNPQKGKVELFGHEINELNLKYLRENVGIIFQNPDNQFIGFTAEDDIAFGLENKKVDPEKMKAIIDRVAKVVNIEDLLTYEVQRLSGGQKQRVAIASVLAMDPRIIIFDESTSMLDPKSKNELKKLMLVLKNDYKKTIISITHDMEEVINADRVIIMKQGKLLKMDTPKKTFENKSFLNEIMLDIPFVLDLSKELSEYDNKINPTLDLNYLIEQIWSSKTK